MRIDNPSDYQFVKFRKSKTKGKKYDALLMNKKTKRNKTVPFGAKGYEHYEDSTGLGLYSHLDHKDKQRRRNFMKRHNSNAKHKFSSAWFAKKFLW